MTRTENGSFGHGAADRSKNTSQEHQSLLAERINQVAAERNGCEQKPPELRKEEIIMVTFLLFICLISYGLSRATQTIKNNPSQSMAAAEWLKRMFTK